MIQYYPIFCILWVCLAHNTSFSFTMNIDRPISTVQIWILSQTHRNVHKNVWYKSISTMFFHVFSIPTKKNTNKIDNHCRYQFLLSLPGLLAAFNLTMSCQLRELSRTSASKLRLGLSSSTVIFQVSSIFSENYFSVWMNIMIKL